MEIDGQSIAERRDQFREQKAAQLAQERGDVAPPPPPGPTSPPPAPADSGPPESELESAPGNAPTEDLPLAPGDELEGEDAEPQLEASEDGLPSSEETGEYDPEDSTNWRKRYEDTKDKLREVTENRTVMEREHADILSQQLGLRYELEDTARELKTYVNNFTGMYDNQIAQLEQAFNSGMIEPDKLPAARQQYQQLQQMKQGLQQQYQQVTEQQSAQQQRERERQAEIARMRLSRTIPGWSREKHAELGNYAMERGFSSEEFSKNLDYRFLEILHDAMQYRRAGDTLTDVTRQRKPKPPRRSKEPERGPDGRFRRAEQDFRSNPGQKGRFAAMKFEEMQRDRRRGR